MTRILGRFDHLARSREDALSRLLRQRDADRWMWHEDGSATLIQWRTGRQYHVDVTGACSCGEPECRHSRGYRLMRGEVD